MAISVAADAVVFSTTPEARENLMVLLVTRKNEPFKGARVFPGGFVNEDESLMEASARELREETGLDSFPVGQLAERSDIGRDPRGRVISFPFVFVVKDCPEVVGADDAETAEWVKVEDLSFGPEDPGETLGFDHTNILLEAVLPFTVL